MKLLVTAGPTREPIDPVRFLSNRSSGKMGYAVAEAAVEAGHEVCLVSGPVSLPVPGGVRCMQVVTAEEMCAAVAAELEACEVLVMVAAVADFRPSVVLGDKIKKSNQPLNLELEPTADILKVLLPRKESRLFVGFAAETGDPLAEARRKLEEKGLDLVVANDVSQPGSGFEVDTNQVTLLHKSGEQERLACMTKRAVAQHLVARIEAMHARVERR